MVVYIYGGRPLYPIATLPSADSLDITLHMYVLGRDYFFMISKKSTLFGHPKPTPQKCLYDEFIKKLPNPMEYVAMLL